MNIGNLIQVSAEHMVPSLLGIYLFYFIFKGLLINVENKYLISGIYSAVGALSGVWYFFHQHAANEGEEYIYILAYSPLLIVMFIYWYILVISYITLKKNKFKILIMLIIVLSIVSIGSVLRSQEYSNKNESENKIIPVKALSTHEDALGMTEKNMDIAFINKFESIFKDKFITTLKQAYIDEGYDPSYATTNITSRSFYVSIEGKKLAVIHYNIDNNVRSAVILGFKNNEMLRVFCTRAGNADILIANGECKKEIEKTFGVSFSNS
jgi:hypothetical protein